MASKAEQRLQAALDTLSPQVRKAFDQAIRDHVGSIDVKELERLIAERRINEAIDLLRIKPAFTFPLTETIWNGYTTGGAFAKAELRPKDQRQVCLGERPAGRVSVPDCFSQRKGEGRFDPQKFNRLVEPPVGTRHAIPAGAQGFRSGHPRSRRVD